MHVSKRVTIVRTDDFELVLEYNKEYAVIHAPRVDKMTKKIFVEGHMALEDISDFVTYIGYDKLRAAVPADDKVGQKLAERFGFEKIGEDGGFIVYDYGEL